MTKVLLVPGHDIRTTPPLWRVTESADAFAIVSSKLTMSSRISLYVFLGAASFIVGMAAHDAMLMVRMAAFALGTLFFALAYMLWSKSHGLDWLVFNRQTGEIAIPRIDLHLNAKKIVRIIAVTVGAGEDTGSDVYLDAFNDAEERVLIKVVCVAGDSGVTLGKELAGALKIRFEIRNNNLGETVEFIDKTTPVKSRRERAEEIRG